MLDRLFALEAFGIKLGLENISHICAALGHPERSYPTLHVAGTNGKGSVTAMAHAALVAAGYHAARYTSPHLTDLAERFVVGGSETDADTLGQVAEFVLDRIDRLRADGVLSAPPTFFEATTAIGFELFRRASVDVAVIEVGLGGRFDATNVISPAAAAITSIAFDHQQHLGSTLGAIAFEKAGIIKPGMTVITGALPDAAMEAVRRIASERGATLVEAAADADVRSEMHMGQAEVQVATPDGRYGPIVLSLRGTHQIGNALVAIRLLETARKAGFSQLTTASIERGLATAAWPARLELLALPNGRRVLLDAAHNVEGAQALATYLAEWHPQPPALVLGVMRDKDVEGILRILLPVTSVMIATMPASRRAMDAAELAAQARALDPMRAVGEQRDSTRAVEEALIRDTTVCVAGSILLAGAVRDVFKRRAILQ